MEQSLAVVTLGISDRERSVRFYVEGFGWTPVFENEEIVFFQMNGLMLGLWSASSLGEDMRRPPGPGPGAVALAHNVRDRAHVYTQIARLVDAGGRLLRAADAPPHGGYRGYVADPDGHAWEIAWNPSWTVDAQGRWTFGL